MERSIKIEQEGRIFEAGFDPDTDDLKINVWHHTEQLSPIAHFTISSTDAKFFIKELLKLVE